MNILTTKLVSDYVIQLEVEVLEVVAEIQMPLLIFLRFFTLMFNFAAQPIMLVCSKYPRQHTVRHTVTNMTALTSNILPLSLNTK